MSQIIPVASGKGGVGKSLLSANLAIALGQQGKKVVLVDLDLGASNLHLVIGQKPGAASLGSWFTEKSPVFLFTYNNSFFIYRVFCIKIEKSQKAMATLTNLTEYAENLGLAFQICDDILDVEGDEEKLGKKTGMDSDRGKLTYPALFGIGKFYSAFIAIMFNHS